MYSHQAMHPDVRVKSAHQPHDPPVVFIIDNDAATRGSVAALVRSAGFEPQAFSSASEFLSAPRSIVPSCMILDVELGDVGGLDLQERVSAERPHMPFIFFTDNDDLAVSVKAMKAGAVDFLCKSADRDVLLSAVDEAIARSRSVLARDTEMRNLRERHVSLSRREQEVLALVVAGLRNKQVAFELGISEITVKAHRGHAMRKMLARSLPELVNMASQLGILH